MAKGFCGQPATVAFDETVPGQLVRDPIVIRRVYHHGHRREVLGSGAQHGGAADVYVLQRVVQRHSGAADGGDEGI